MYILVLLTLAQKNKLGAVFYLTHGKNVGGVVMNSGHHNRDIHKQLMLCFLL